ncbi:MAG TPA: hypothetical protein VHN99_06610, partial [Deinococcales bacterium]|nr:hypothetical protein [Deinococcales bacterium]
MTLAPPPPSPGNLWDRQQGESPRAYAAFRAYLELGPGRSLDAAYRAAKGPQKGRTAGRWKAWAAGWSWASRAQALDEHLARVEVERLEGERAAAAVRWHEREEKLREREFELANRLLDQVEQMTKAPLFRRTVEDEVTGPDGTVHQTIVVEPAKWTGNTIAHFLRTASQVGRLAAGAVTERVQQVLAGAPLEELSDDELDRLAGG